MHVLEFITIILLVIGFLFSATIIIISEPDLEEKYSEHFYSEYKIINTSVYKEKKGIPKLALQQEINRIMSAHRDYKLNQVIVLDKKTVSIIIERRIYYNESRHKN